MADEVRVRARIISDNPIKITGDGATPLVWTIGWLLTIGVGDLGFWDGALALFIWPVYFGEILRAVWGYSG